jgi:cytochrome c-type biogenesis protein CcmH/NrfG
MLLSASVIFLFLPSPFSFKLPLLVTPSFESSWQIAHATLTSGVPQLFFGSGPGTFSLQYALFKPVNVNASPFWELLFDRSASAFLTRLSDIGLVGTLAWVVCMGWIGMLSLKRLVRVRDHQTWKMTYVLFVAWSMLVLSQVLYASNMTLEFLLWAISGMLVAHLLPSVWKTDFKRSPKLGLLASFLFLFVIVEMVVSMFLVGGRFFGERAFVQAVQLDAKQGDRQQVIKYLREAVRFNPLNDTYARNLSFALFLQASQKIQGLHGQKMTAEQTKEISENVSAAVLMGVRATKLETNKVANWQFLGMLYREVMPFAENAETLAASAFMNTIRLEPTNPTHFVDLARVYLAVADRAHALKQSEDADQAKQAQEQEQKLLSTAEEALKRAIELKGDYLPAHYYLAATYDREGELDQAIKRLVALVKNTPNDIGLGFELAQLYIRSNNVDAAKHELERLITINPQYANALWYLASVYEMQNDQEKAIEFVKKVLLLNPNNKAVQERLKKLEIGQEEVIIPEPLQPEVPSVR